jgi:hypothetical protein
VVLWTTVRYTRRTLPHPPGAGDPSARMSVVKDGRVVEEDVPLRSAMNEVLRDG